MIPLGGRGSSKATACEESCLPGRGIHMEMAMRETPTRLSTNKAGSFFMGIVYLTFPEDLNFKRSTAG